MIATLASAMIVGRSSGVVLSLGLDMRAFFDGLAGGSCGRRAPAQQHHGCCPAPAEDEDGRQDNEEDKCLASQLLLCGRTFGAFCRGLWGGLFLLGLFLLRHDAVLMNQPGPPARVAVQIPLWMVKD